MLRAPITIVPLRSGLQRHFSQKSRHEHIELLNAATSGDPASAAVCEALLRARANTPLGRYSTGSILVHNLLTGKGGHGELPLSGTGGDHWQTGVPRNR